MKRPIIASEAIEVAELLSEAVHEIPAHEACGVDSFSIVDRALEYVGDTGWSASTLEEMIDMEDMDDRTCRFVIFFFEFEFFLEKLRMGSHKNDILADIRERFMMDIDE